MLVVTATFLLAIRAISQVAVMVFGLVSIVGALVWLWISYSAWRFAYPQPLELPCLFVIGSVLVDAIAAWCLDRLVSWRISRVRDVAPLPRLNVTIRR